MIPLWLPSLRLPACYWALGVVAARLLALLLAVLELVLARVLVLGLERVLWTPRVAQAGVQEVEVRARVEVRVLAEEVELLPLRLSALLKA